MSSSRSGRRSNPCSWDPVSLGHVLEPAPHPLLPVPFLGCRQLVDLRVGHAAGVKEPEVVPPAAAEGVPVLDMPGDVDRDGALRELEKLVSRQLLVIAIG
jgi:hypothetical protein